MRKALSVAVILFFGVLLLAIDGSADSHRSMGLVIRVNPSEKTVVLLEDGFKLALTVRRATVLLDDQGQLLHSLKALQVGDYVREDCESRESDPSIARKISVLIPAWRMLESPER